MEQNNNQNNYVFRVSERANSLKKYANESSDYFKIIDDYNQEAKENNNLFLVDKNIVKHAFIRICDTWNKDEKARKFLKHLIAAYINISQFNRIFNFSEEQISENKNICAIMNFKLAGIQDIAREYSKFIIDKAKIEVAHTTEEKQKAINEYNEKINNLPSEIRLKRIAYSNTEKSNKFLSQEAYIALIKLFVPEMILGDNEMSKFITLLRRKLNNYKPRYNNKSYKKYNKPKFNGSNGIKQQEKSSNSISTLLSDEQIDKLKSIK